MNPEFKEFQSRKNAFHLPNCITPHYNLDRPQFLGKGGYGVVSRLSTLDSSRFPDIALKKFEGAFKKPKTAQRCYRELLLLSRIEHENIVKLMFAFSPDTSSEYLETVYLVMEYAGKDLTTVIHNETLSNHSYYFKDFKQILIQLLNALQFLNSAKVIHRDLKPQNIAINSSGKLTLLDFGLARVIDTDGEMTSNPGTIYYRAIETMTECTCRYNEKADIWSVGAILCEMITGSILFEDRFPLVKAISLCGPVGEKILSQMNKKDLREYLEKKSKKSERIDFVAHLEKYGRSWMKKEVKRERDNLKSFIDLTLQFDQKRRSQSDPSEMYQSRAEEEEEVEGLSDEEEMIFDSNEEAINHWKEAIWKQLHLIPNPFL